MPLRHDHDRVRDCGHTRAALGLIALLLWVGAAQAQGHPGRVVIYRCTDAHGALTIQNDTPCPKGSKQEKRVMATAVPPPVALTQTPAASVAPPVPAPAVPAPTPEAAPPPSPALAPAGDERQPPPALYECRSHDHERYLSDDGEPPPRCVPMQVVGLSGSAATAAGAACQMIRDDCQRIADGALCERWRQRLRDAQTQLRFGHPASPDAAQAEVERLERIVRESTCAP